VRSEIEVDDEVDVGLHVKVRTKVGAEALTKVLSVLSASSSDPFEHDIKYGQLAHGQQKHGKFERFQAMKAVVSTYFRGVDDNTGTTSRL